MKFFRASCFHDDGGAAQGVDEGEEQEQETPEEPRWFVPTRSTFGLEELDFGRKTSSSSSSFSASLHRSSVQLFASEFDEVDLHEDLEQLGLGGDEDQRGGPEESEEKSDGEDEQRGNAHYDAHEGQTWVASMPSSSGGSASPASSSIVLEERQSSPLPSAMFRLRSIPQSLRLSRNDSRRQVTTSSPTGSNNKQHRRMRPLSIHAHITGRLEGREGTGGVAEGSVRRDAR